MNTGLPELGDNERSLILNCSRLYMGDEVTEQTEKCINDDLNWDSVVFYSKYHSVAPLMFNNLSSNHFIDAVPRSAYRSLLSLKHRTEYQNRIISGILGNIIRDFSGENISVIVLKGIALVELVYKHHGLRPLIDINLLVEKNNLSRAIQILIQNGYSIRKGDPAQGYGYSQFHFSKHDNYEIHILLQWHILNWPRINRFDLYSIWDNAKPVRISGLDTFILSNELLLLYLTMQPDKYGYFNPAAIIKEKAPDFIFREWTNNRLIRYVDIYETLMLFKNDINWSRFEEEVKNCSADNTVYNCLHWTSQLLGDLNIDITDLLLYKNLKPKFSRRLIYDILKSEPELNHFGYRIASRIYRWWHNQKKSTLVHIIQILNILEFTFPNPRELRFLYRYSSDTYCVLYYPFHVIRAVLLILAPALYRAFIKK